MATGDTVLLFSVDFFEKGAFFSVEGQEAIGLEYIAIGEDESDAADKIVGLLCGLANGQISTLVTYTEDNEKVQAFEVLYREKTTPHVLLTYPLFDSARRLRGRQLNFAEHRNYFDIPRCTIDEDFIRSIYPDMEFQSYNRDLTGGALSPLTREMWEKQVEIHYDERADEIIRKVDAWAKISPGASFKEIYWQYAEKRHRSLSLVASFATAIIALGTGFEPFAVIGAAICVLCTIAVQATKKTVWRFIFHPILAYFSAAMMAAVLLTTWQPEIYFIVIAIAVSLELLECIALDVHEKVKELRTA